MSANSTTGHKHARNEFRVVERTTTPLGKMTVSVGTYRLIEGSGTLLFEPGASSIWTRLPRPAASRT